MVSFLRSVFINLLLAYALGAGGLISKLITILRILLYVMLFHLVKLRFRKMKKSYFPTMMIICRIKSVLLNGHIYMLVTYKVLCKSRQNVLGLSYIGIPDIIFVCACQKIDSALFIQFRIYFKQPLLVLALNRLCLSKISIYDSSLSFTIMPYTLYISVNLTTPS